MKFESGQSFAHFKIIRKLGEGGMGEVYLAEDQKLNRRVAIKMLQPEFFDNKERQERFTREARTAAKINHANVMAIYDIDTATDQETGQEFSYIVMEYIEGESLSDYLANRMSAVKDLLRISQKIASGLAAAHKLNIVHRDIKTDNIMIDENDEPKILDFGLAKPIGPAISAGSGDNTNTMSQELTQEGKILGTVTYMSPEQARGEAVDSRSDIFSVGIMLYKMFTGEFPFDGKDRVSTLAKILESRHVPVRKKNETLPAELDRIIEKCLQKDPNDRYQDTRDLVVDLRSLRRQFDSGISDSASIVTGEMNAMAKSGGKKGRGMLMSVSGAIVVLIVAVTIIVSMMGSDDAEGGHVLHVKENGLAILGFENKTGDTTLNWLTTGLPEILLTDLSQGGKVNLISRSRVLDCLADAPEHASDLPSYQACVKAAKSLGASKILSGTFIKFGDKIRIDARLEDVETGDIILGEKVIGDNPFELVDSLTQKIALSLNIQDAMRNNTEVAAITSSSTDAYKQYILGMEKFNVHLMEDAITHFEKAIAIDSTFALPYMRIGMVYSFQSRAQQAAPYFMAAKKYENKLPVKERSLLDIYVDIWMKRNYDDAFTKTKAYVRNYPEDKEARSFYALFLDVFSRQYEAALAQLDTVIILDPKFHLGHYFYSDIYARHNEYQKAIAHAELLKQYYPESLNPYITLMVMYRRLSRIDDALRTAEELLGRDPGNISALDMVTRIGIMKDDFDMSLRYNELIKKYHGDDPYRMMEYYNNIANLDVWQGKFKHAQEMEHKVLEQTLLANDSMQVSGQYHELAKWYELFELSDSALYYGDLSFQWATPLQGFGYPFLMVTIDPASAPQARPLFDTKLSAFRSMLPEEMWPLTDILDSQFTAVCQQDTAEVIRFFEILINEHDQSGTDNRFSLGRYKILFGQSAEGIEHLNTVISGENETTNALYFIRSLYYIGLAQEALGQTADAIANYQKVLRYWDNADLPLKLIDDTRRRLKMLTS
ncbi:MAG: protein kinase [candidate division Zixibacteria bacterium]|nr:protein kinase [candidate division Zixibacteria bacterium]